jgi:hypothetical protein
MPTTRGGQQPEQGQAEHGRTNAEDEPVGGDPAIRIKLAHRTDRRQR